jgi:imidazolonepropionase-like amidohydrolase
MARVVSGYFGATNMKYLLKADSVLTGKRGEVIRDGGAVLVEDEKIVWIGAQAQFDQPLDSGTEVIDFGVMTLMPGMIDCHVHLGFDGSADPVAHMKQSSDVQLLVTMLYNARLLLKSGVTTAREMGARGYLDLVVKEAVLAGTAPGPNLIVCNRPITTTGGHCWFMGCECDDVTQVRRAVREHAKAGADFMKIMLTGGFMTKGSAPWYTQFDQYEMDAVAYEAHRLDKKIAVHAHGTPGIISATKAGVDTIEHCSWVTSSGFEYDQECAEKIVAQGIHVCLTTNIAWSTRITQREERFHNIRRMRELGMTFIAGTDAGINFVPHDKYVAGLETLRDIGLTNEEIIESATIVAAEGCGLEKVTGSLTTGKRADIIAIKGDPLADISALWNVGWVMRAGTVPDFAMVG